MVSFSSSLYAPGTEAQVGESGSPPRKVLPLWTPEGGRKKVLGYTELGSVPSGATWAGSVNMITPTAPAASQFFSLLPRNIFPYLEIAILPSRLIPRLASFSLTLVFPTLFCQR